MAKEEADKATVEANIAAGKANDAAAKADTATLNTNTATDKANEAASSATTAAENANAAVERADDTIASAETATNRRRMQLWPQTRQKKMQTRWQIQPMLPLLWPMKRQDWRIRLLWLLIQQRKMP